ncbi:MAG: hypothetical protein O3B75_10860 [Planctomycetota bacterium]|nr:hypothetical protein [Planctomycetota bacterium]
MPNSLLEQLNGCAEQPPSTAELRSIAAKLGRLATWWLNDQSIKKIRETPTGVSVLQEFPVQVGEALVLFERKGSSCVLRSAFALPVCWKRGTQDKRLPPDLARIAKEMTDADPGSPFALHLGDGCPSLAEFDETILPCMSAAAILAATLRAVCEGGTLDPTVSATATWDTNLGAGSVDATDAKVVAAWERGVKILFMAQADVEKLKPTSQLHPPIEIKGLESGKAALAPLITALDLPPENGSFNLRCRWQERAAFNKDNRAPRFYQSQLANDVAANTIARFQTNPTAAPVARGGTLVIAHSTAIEPALLSVAIHKPDHVVLLSLPPTRGSFNQAEMNGIEELLIKSSISVETIELICPYIVDEHAISTALKTTVGCQTRKLPVRIDITPGPKDLTLALYQWAVRNAAPCWLIVNKIEGGKIIVDPVYLVSLGEL